MTLTVEKHFSRSQAWPVRQSAPETESSERVANLEKIKSIIFRGRWCDVINLIIGAGLFLSPWVLGFAALTPNTPQQSAGVFGVVIGLTAFATLTAFEVWEEYIIVAASLGAIVSPWVFGFSAPAAITHVVLGTMSLILSVYRLWLLRRMQASTAKRKL